MEARLIDDELQIRAWLKERGMPAKLLSLSWFKRLAEITECEVPHAHAIHDIYVEGSIPEIPIYSLRWEVRWISHLFSIGP